MLAERTGTPWCFVLNSGAIGDIVAAVPVIKFAIDHIWNNPEAEYKVIVADYFMPLFHFVPKKHLAELGTHVDLKGVPHSIVKLNDVIDTAAGPSANITPLRMQLTDYASVKLLNTVLPIEHKNYPLLPLGGTSINKFNLPKRYVCICATEVNRNRALPFEEITKVSEHLLEMGITPVYLGKSDRPFETYGSGDKYGKSATPIEGVIDLTNKTTLMEAAKIMAKSECVIGADTGLVHLAACSDVKIICCYTTVHPNLRMPVRRNVVGWNVIPIEPDKEGCRYCQSNWWLNNWNFNQCLNNDSYDCLSATKADRIIEALSRDFVLDLAFKQN